MVKDGTIIAEGANQVTSSNDPTAHAEVVAIRRACQALGTFELAGCEIYTSCEPCPMCLSAIYWARLGRIYYGNNRHDAEKVGFRDDFLYREIAVPLEQRLIPTSRLLSNRPGRHSRSGTASWTRFNTDASMLRLKQNATREPAAVSHPANASR